MFESAQKVQKLKVLLLKRINTVCWNSCEFSLKVVLLQYDCVMKVLEDIVRSRRVMDGEIARDEPEATPLAHWKCETFHVAVAI